MIISCSINHFLIRFQRFIAQSSVWFKIIFINLIVGIPSTFFAAITALIQTIIRTTATIIVAHCVASFASFSQLGHTTLQGSSSTYQNCFDLASNQYRLQIGQKRICFITHLTNSFRLFGFVMFITFVLLLKTSLAHIPPKKSSFCITKHIPTILKPPSMSMIINGISAILTNTHHAR